MQRLFARSLCALPPMFALARYAQTESELSPSEFRALKCVRNEPHTHNTHKITFAYPAKWAPGPVHNLLFKMDGEIIMGSCCACCKCESCSCSRDKDDCCSCCGCGKRPCSCPKKAAPESKSVTRPYNPLSTEKGDITICVKRYGEEAKMGSFMHNLKPGDTVEAKGPNQQWAWEKGKYSHYGLIAGGTGLTPLMQATNHILKNDTAKVTLVCFNQTPEDILLSDDLGKLLKAYPDRFTVHHVIENNPKNRTSWDHWTKSNLTGRPSAQLLKKLIPPPGNGVLIMQCGRPPMTAEVAGPKAKDFTQGPVGGILAELGYNSNQVWKL